MILFTDKKKNTHIAIQVQAFRRKPKKLRLFSSNKKVKALREVKEKPFNGKLHLRSNPVKQHLQQHKPQKLIYSSKNHEKGG